MRSRPLGCPLGRRCEAEPRNAFELRADVALAVPPVRRDVLLGQRKAVQAAADLGVASDAISHGGQVDPSYTVGEQVRTAGQRFAAT